MAKTATEFEKMIHSDRSRKKNEALAAKIFGKTKAASPAAGGKLAARAGIKKRVVSTTAAPSRPGNINSEWTHDLHDGSNTRKNTSSAAAAKAPGSLASRVSRPGEAAKPKKGGAAAPAAPATASTRGRQQRRVAQVANALNRAELQQKPRQQQPQRQQQTNNASGLSIRGIAAAVNEPLVIMAQNFAPGTTAADIESAMTPVGGLVSSCRILKTTPLVIAEIMFESREGAERVIATFNNQTADGRVLHVYPKLVNSGVLVPHNSHINTQAAPRAQPRGKSNAASSHLVDGSLGFDDPMDTDGLGRNGNLNGQLYSDDLVGTHPAPGTGRRGRGRGGRR
ncbi:pentatricopeptide repeat protein [Ophiostoma piceae UAMH 11346]|uniref:Pentatricopeptide repeat protein n=1 Tax=Ophiostoma piceae (strain UAMH 11346) TaxID=1262450 RepID=S3BY67_OPHP1|nr:pentatricopeptide repeat protein [Ophiostoma piceae UAMH 11346]